MTDGYLLPKRFHDFILDTLENPPFRHGYINVMYRKKMREKEGEK